MKTILIAIFQAVEVKNILRTNVIKALLADPQIKVVCLARFPERASYYAQEIPYPRIIYDAFYRTPRSILERFLSSLKFYLIKTKTTDLKRSMYYQESGRAFSYILGNIFNYILARKSVRGIARFVDYHFIPDSGFGAVLDKYRPQVVVLSHLFDDAEIALLRESRRRTIPTVGFINSWDKLTARCAIRLLPDRLVVYNDIVKKEAMEHADMPEERIHVCGIPQYDQYFTDKSVSREKFFKKVKLDPKKHLILYAPMGSTFSDSDWEMMDLLHSLISKENFLSNSQLFVRFQPNDFVDENELKARPWLKYDLPGLRYGTERGGDWDMTFEDLKHLAGTLRHTSILVSYASSISVDAALMGKPVININFELKPQKSPFKSPTQYYRTDHYQKALAAGGIRLVHNEDELRYWINAYLKHPSLDEDGRKRLVQEQCWMIDGKAGERIAEAIIQFLSPSL